VDLSGVYTGNVLVSHVETNDPATQAALSAGIDRRPFKIRVKHLAKKTLRVTDHLGAVFRGRRIGRNSFEAADSFDSETGDCTLSIHYKLSRIESRKAILSAVFDEVCSTGVTHHLEFKGRVRRH